MFAKHKKLGNIETGVYFWTLEDFALVRQRVKSNHYKYEILDQEPGGILTNTTTY